MTARSHRWLRATFQAYQSLRRTTPLLPLWSQLARIGWQMLLFRLWGTPDPRWKPRLKACWRCIHFHRPLRTCGQAGSLWANPLTGAAEQEGCMCGMEFKVLLPEAECWKATVTNGVIDYWAETDVE